MLLAHIHNPSTYQSFLTDRVWQQALEWIKQNGSAEVGEYEIDGRNLYALVQTIQTIPLTQGTFEAHQKYIDLHYCIEGGEQIGWTPLHALSRQKESNPGKDYTLYEISMDYTLLHLTPGMFAMFLPQDAHMPKLQDGIHTSVKKAVIKIRYTL